MQNTFDAKAPKTLVTLSLIDFFSRHSMDESACEPVIHCLQDLITPLPDHAYIEAVQALMEDLYAEFGENSYEAITMTDEELDESVENVNLRKKVRALKVLAPAACASFDTPGDLLHFNNFLEQLKLTNVENVLSLATQILQEFVNGTPLSLEITLMRHGVPDVELNGGVSLLDELACEEGRARLHGNPELLNVVEDPILLRNLKSFVETGDLTYFDYQAA